MKLSSRIAPLSIGACALILGTAAVAHHSTAMFDMQKTIKVVGVVKQFDWTNPHTFIWIDVQENGSSVEYSFEGMSPNYLSRNGWTRHTIEPGQTIGLEFHPLKDGRKGGFCARVTLPNGTNLNNLPGPPPPPPGPPPVAANP